MRSLLTPPPPSSLVSRLLLAGHSDLVLFAEIVGRYVLDRDFIYFSAMLMVINSYLLMVGLLLYPKKPEKTLFLIL